jgi:hypothetical protein
MIYLTVPPAAGACAPLITAGIGVIRTPEASNCVDFVQRWPCWGADNGCFARGDRFDLGAYLDWLTVMAPAQATCLFATAPDVVGNAVATWQRSAPVLPELRRLGYRAALVAQDGIDPATVDWTAFDVLFVGGTDAFKLAESTYALVAEAKRQHKWTHLGRANSWRRLRAAAAAGYDSADGSTMRFNTVRYIPEVARWGVALASVRRLPLEYAR